MALASYILAMPNINMQNTSILTSMPMYPHHQIMPNVVQPTKPDKPIGYGAFGAVWAVTDPRDGKRVALKKLPNVFHNLVSCKRVYRELSMLCHFKHDNILATRDIIQPANINAFDEVYLILDLMQSDLHKIIVSPQPLTADHVKVFMYQLLRGIKYLHTAHVLHRDIKPGNLLVNSNCVLKICDFGLSRVDVSERERHMTQEVVTQYYRPPELLMGAKTYTDSIDIWSIACVFAELLSRRILFQAPGPLQQLKMIIELLGTPSDEITCICDSAKRWLSRQPYRPPQLHSLYSISSRSNHEAIDLLLKMLQFDPDKRISAEEALNHPYLEEGRLRYHSCMCSCCHTTANGTRVFCKDLEPECYRPFSYRFEDELCSVQRVREKMFKLIAQFQRMNNRAPMCINPNSLSYQAFANSGIASSSELPPSPHQWE